MTTSSSYTFDPSFAALLDEALERAGIDPSKVSGRHIKSAKMSLNLMFADWAAADGDAIYRVDHLTTTVASGTDNFSVASGVFDVLDITIAYGTSTTEVPVGRISRQEYLNIPNKTTTGQPSLYYVDQSTINAPVVYFWPVPAASTAVSYDCMRFTQTVLSLSETLDINRQWLDAVAAGLALRLAKKYNPNRAALLEGDYGLAYRRARTAFKGRSQITISANGFGSGMRRRR